MEPQHLENIKNDRIPNISRILGLRIFFFFVYYSNLEIIYPALIIDLIGSISWFVFIEFFYDKYLKYPSTWFVIATIDILIVILFIYLSGVTYSTVTVGLIFIVAQSSFDPIKIRGKYATYASISLYILLIILSYLKILPYYNIISSNTSEGEISFVSTIVSSGLIIVGCVAVNSIISSIYFQLRDKSSELEKSYSEIKKLKDQQDFDYYLTLQLIEPLSESNPNLNQFHIQMFDKQYKKFSFKNNIFEIGGDISLTDTIYLGNSKFLFYINADAMGKSLQGAGGILVLTSVMKSFLFQYNSPNSYSANAKTWLINRFSDLNQVFLSFEGMMMVSLNMGIIEENTHHLYFLNAEHPFTVLYRDKRASFIEKLGNFNRKLGTMTLNAKKDYYIHDLVLEKGDVLFIGSDGKDDILISNGSELEINSDEKLFLQLVEDSDGNFEKLKEFYSTSELLTDDTSLIRLEFNF